MIIYNEVNLLYITVVVINAPYRARSRCNRPTRWMHGVLSLSNQLFPRSRWVAVVVRVGISYRILRLSKGYFLPYRSVFYTSVLSSAVVLRYFFAKFCWIREIEYQWSFCGSLLGCSIAFLSSGSCARSISNESVVGHQRSFVSWYGSG